MTFALAMKLYFAVASSTNSPARSTFGAATRPSWFAKGALGSDCAVKLGETVDTVATVPPGVEPLDWST